MGKYFKTSEELIETLSALFDKVKFDREIGEKISETKVVIRFEYTDPDASVTVSCKNPPEGLYGVYNWNIKDPDTEIVMKSSADWGHKFWHGKENPIISLTFGKVKVEGDITRALALLPLLQPVFKVYPTVLKEKGKGNIAL